nr:MAG: ORF1 [TTV-like mini virus]
MPWRTYYRRYRYRPRRRLWHRRRYFRRPFQRRLWKRRHRRVRKRKLKSIKIKQWQPQYIKRLKVVGLMPLFLTTSERTTNNFTCYIDSTAPHLFPSGGGFSINNFTLRGLYQNHSVLQNWWTVSNDNMPLIRYLGVTIYLYRNYSADYLFLYNNSYPMTSQLITYTSSHPQAMLLHKHTKKIVCKQGNRNKKPYKKLKIRAPSQMYNKWYFQHDIADVPLLQTICTSTSLDRMFLNSKAISSTVGFTSLDIRGFTNHDYSKLSTTGYIPQPNTLLFGTRRRDISYTNLKITDLIFLGNAEDLKDGTTIGAAKPDNISTEGTDTQRKIIAVRQNWQYWGNPFDPSFRETGKLLTTNRDWNYLIQEYKDNKNLQTTDFVEKTHFLVDCRYNPFADKGIGNKVYFVDIKDRAHATDWDIPVKDTLYENLPIWLTLWGYLDFHRKCGEHSQVDTNYLLVIKCKYMFPKEINYFVPLDHDFLEGRSPYQEHETIFNSDLQNWHPKVRYQVRTINMLGSTGPGVIKLPPETSAEAHCRYAFHFKIGGQPPPMATLTDPLQQPKYITPDNILQTPSLQNPATPLEHILWNFDERRGLLTKKAIKRITSDKETEPTLFPITETTFACPTTSYQETQTPETSESEEKEMSIEEQLHHQRKQQKLLRHRIKQLLHRLTVIE